MIKEVGEEPLDGIAAVFVGWQADTMDDQKADNSIAGTRIEVGGRHAANAA
jgi:hypothetical protein